MYRLFRVVFEDVLPVIGYYIGWWQIGYCSVMRRYRS
jgi:hypothetical protein